MRAILHIDMDAFYASVEEQDHPELKGKPLIVGGTGGRAVVAAASYAVRSFGVRSAMPMVEALRRCPQVIVVPPRMARYQEVSARVFEIFREFTPLVEGLSLDEAFLDVTGSERLLGQPEAIGAEIRRRIAQQTGLTASVGIAPNKLLAKIASDLHKPDGMCRIDAGNLREVLDPLPIHKLFGVGQKPCPRFSPPASAPSAMRVAQRMTCCGELSERTAAPCAIGPAGSTIGRWSRIARRSPSVRRKLCRRHQGGA